MEAIWAWITTHWIEWLFAVITSALIALYRNVCKRIKDSKDEQEALRDGMRSILKDRQIQTYNYRHDKGYFPIYARETFDEMYNAYHKLGGNGTITDQVKIAHTLPTDPEDVQNKRMDEE